MPDEMATRRWPGDISSVAAEGAGAGDCIFDHSDWTDFASILVDDAALRLSIGAW